MERMLERFIFITLAFFLSNGGGAGIHRPVRHGFRSTSQLSQGA